MLGISHPTLLKLLRERKIPEPQVYGNSRLWFSADVQHAQIVLKQLRQEGELRLKGKI